MEDAIPEKRRGGGDKKKNNMVEALRGKMDKKASDTQSSRYKGVVYMDREQKYTHAHVHLHSEAKPLSRVEVKMQFNAQRL